MSKYYRKEYKLENYSTKDKKDLILNDDREVHLTSWDQSSDTYLYGQDSFPSPWTNPKQLRHHLDSLLDLYGDKTDKIYWIDNLEVYNIDNYWYDTFLHINVLRKWVEENNLQDRFIYCTNNAIGNYKVFNHRPITTFLGYQNRVEQYPPTGRWFEKHFLYLNRKPRVHRLKFFEKMLKGDVLDDCFFSIRAFKPAENTLAWNTDLENWKTISPSNLEGTVYDIAPYYFTKSFCNLVIETTFNTNYEYYGDSVFITEKTDKAIRFGQPFIILGQPNFLKELKSLGFKTFDKWWDESYDKVLNDDDRMECVFKLVKEIKSWDFDKIHRVYREMEEILTHNQKVRNYILAYKIRNVVCSKKVFEQNQFTFYDDLKNYLQLMLNN